MSKVFDAKSERRVMAGDADRGRNVELDDADLESVVGGWEDPRIQGADGLPQYSVGDNLALI